jgi:hypothetical protein
MEVEIARGWLEAWFSDFAWLHGSFLSNDCNGLAVVSRGLVVVPFYLIR